MSNIYQQIMSLACFHGDSSKCGIQVPVVSVGRATMKFSRMDRQDCGELCIHLIPK